MAATSNVARGETHFAYRDLINTVSTGALAIAVGALAIGIVIVAWPAVVALAKMFGQLFYLRWQYEVSITILTFKMIGLVLVVFLAIAALQGFGQCLFNRK